MLLLLPTEHNKLTLAWRGPYRVVGKVGDVNYRVEVEPNKVKTYHINILKRYYRRKEKKPDLSGQVSGNTGPQSDVASSEQDECTVEQAAAVACVIEDNSQEEDEGATIKDADLLPLYSAQQKETVEDVNINPKLSQAQTNDLKQLLREYRQIFSDVPTVTHLVEHKVELTQTEPVRCKPYPTPYKMQEIVDKEIDSMLAMGIIERSEAPYASPLVLVKKADGTYRVCINFKELNKITVFDP